VDSQGLDVGNGKHSTNPRIPNLVLIHSTERNWIAVILKRFSLMLQVWVRECNADQQNRFSDIPLDGITGSICCVSEKENGCKTTVTSGKGVHSIRIEDSVLKNSERKRDLKDLHRIQSLIFTSTEYRQPKPR